MLAVRTQRTVLCKKLRNEGAHTGNLRKQISCPLPRHLDTCEPNQIEKDPSTRNRLVVQVSKTVFHIMLPSAKVQRKTLCLSWFLLLAICYHEERSSGTDTMEITVCANRTYSCRVSFGVLLYTMHITRCLLDTGFGLSFVNKTLIPQPWKHRNQRKSLPKLRTASKRPHYVEDRLLHHVCYASFYIKD